MILWFRVGCKWSSLVLRLEVNYKECTMWIECLVQLVYFGGVGFLVMGSTIVVLVQLDLQWGRLTFLVSCNYSMLSFSESLCQFGGFKYLSLHWWMLEFGRCLCSVCIWWVFCIYFILPWLPEEVFWKYSYQLGYLCPHWVDCFSSYYETFVFKKNLAIWWLEKQTN